MAAAALVGVGAAAGFAPVLNTRFLSSPGGILTGETITVPNASAAAFMSTLTTYAQGYAYDIRNSPEFLADFLAPPVQTGAAQGYYKVFDSKTAFAAYNAQRAIGGQRLRIGFSATDQSFVLLPNGLEVTVDDHERDQAGNSGAFDIEQVKIRYLVNAAYRSRELGVWTAAKAAVTATPSVGDWTDDTVDPIAEIDSLIEAINTDTGYIANRMILSLSAWRALKENAKVKARRAGIYAGSPTFADIAAMTINPRLEIRVGSIPYDTAKAGLAQSNANIIGSEAWLFYASSNADLMDPSFMKSFSISETPVQAVKKYREQELIDVFAVDWTERQVVTAPLSGRRLVIT